MKKTVWNKRYKNMLAIAAHVSYRSRCVPLNSSLFGSFPMVIAEIHFAQSLAQKDALGKWRLGFVFHKKWQKFDQIRGFYPGLLDFFSGLHEHDTGVRRRFKIEEKFIDKRAAHRDIPNATFPSLRS